MKYKYSAILMLLILTIAGLFGCGTAKNESLSSVAEEPTEELTEAPEEEIEIPEYYNSADNGRSSGVKNQGESGKCWAVASTSALEAALLPQESFCFSSDHMVENSGFGLEGQAGGDYVMVMAYLSRWAGPVSMIDSDGDGTFDAESDVEKHVQEMQIIEKKDYEGIKKAVIKYGAVEGSVYFATNEDQIDYDYYNQYECSYCYPYEASPNHQLLIVGWDDNYPMERFLSGATEDGAFICQNSWGETFGENGYFYVSYSDYLIGTYNLAFTEIENTDNYDNIYQYDICGWVGRMGYDSSKAYFSNVFDCEKNETIEAVSFYTLAPHTTYRVYVCPDFKDETSLDVNSVVYASGIIRNQGYYTIKLDTPVDVDGGCRFAVIVEVDSPGDNHPVAIEMSTGDDRSSMVTLEGKESYLSSNGTDWERTQETSECNVCLKCFTSDR